MAELDATKVTAAKTYNAAADVYADEALSFWDRFGGRTVERMSLRPGDRVFDVCSGAGASALPAAARVLSDGHVLGIDLAENLLRIARDKSLQQGLSNVEFRVGDLEAEPLPPESFDGVICVFGIFFLPDIPRAIAKLWQCVRPGGELAITTWGPRFSSAINSEPANSAFWESIRTERPELHKGFNPWDKITEPEALRVVMEQGGIGQCDIVAEEARHPIRSPGDWWKIVLGTGYRGTIDQLDDQARRRVQQMNLDFIDTNGVQEVETNVVFAIARKPLF